MPSPQPAAEAAKVAPAPAPVPVAEAAPAPAVPEPTVDRNAAPTPAAEVAPDPHPPVEAKPVNGLFGEPHVDAAAKPVPTPVPVPAQEPAAAKPAPSAVEATPPPARTLEYVVGELLEPVIRKWLDDNLPRLVEEVVRAEVARAIAAERSTPKV
jgi:cell pole-organizing protein PopZ